jgi:DNA-binding CsgD family transcriptional regulator
MAKRAAAVAEIRQLCCLGLPAQEVMPALLTALHRFVPSFSNLFDWVDEDGQITNYYSEEPYVAEVAQRYFQVYYNRREREVMPAYSEHVRTARGVVNSDAISNPAFYGSDFYNEIWRPRQVHHKLEAIIRANGRALGSLVLYRSPGDAQFSKQDEQSLCAIIPYVAHAVGGPARFDGRYTPSGESGMAIVDRRGKLLYRCSEARRLLYLAAHPVVDPVTVAAGSDAALPPAVATLARALADGFRGAPTPPPVYRHANAWGRFVFRAHWLDGHAGMTESLIGITIERELPLPLRAARAAFALPLSVRQRELCVLLAQGLSYLQIAARMCLSQHTVVSYARVVYDKLNVAGRDQLGSALLGRADPCALPTSDRRITPALG